MSEIRATTISDAAGTGPIALTGQSAAKAWVNFNGTGTVAIRDSLNFSSITDQGTGDYDATIANSMANNNYAVSGISNGSGYSNALQLLDGNLALTNVPLRCTNSSSSRINSNVLCVKVIGDLA